MMIKSIATAPDRALLPTPLPRLQFTALFTPLLTLLLALLLSLALAPRDATAQPVRPVGCLGPNGTLPVPAQPGIELIVSRPCKVLAGTYKFGDVHVLEGGTLEFTDAKIDFWASNILVEKDGALVAGSPAAPIGTSGGVVTIHLWGADQTGSNPDKQGQGIPCYSDNKGHCGVPDDLWNSNVDGMGMPVAPATARKISQFASAANYPAKRTDDYFYPYDPLTFDGASDATHAVGYFGYKVIGVSYGGSVQLYGRKGATYAQPECGVAPSTSGTSWVRLDAPVLKNTSGPLIVDRPISLSKGDQIVLTATDYLPGNSEQLTVAADVVCSKSITVEQTFAHTHNGTRFPLTAVPARVGLDPQLQAAGAETRAAVGVLTRSIRIVSAGDTIDDDFPAAPPPRAKEAGYYFGGQFIARQGFKSVQIQGVEFYQMGQGGRIGHYPVHFHHARQTPENTFVRDSSIHDSMTRWIVLHGTQDVKLERNVGYLSIGHGYYLEDGTEINNSFIANLGVFARAAVDNIQNPRKVPGILVAPDLVTTVGEKPAYRSDYDHPTIFWIMNAYNDFRDNMAVGAGTCGVCYWMLPGYISGMAREMKWASYASIQNGLDRAGMAPLKSFVGNSCSTAMTAFQTITDTEACQGVSGDTTDQPRLVPISNPLSPPSAAPAGTTDPKILAAAAAKAAMYYPNLGDGGHFPTQCTTDDCSVKPFRCSAGSPEGCMVTVLDHFTTSFNWAAFNFAAIWLRPQWYLVTDSVITDSQQAGLTIVTGGGYTESDVVPGHWALVRKSVFIGNTQDCPTCAIKSNPLASNGGPFNPGGLRCANDNNQNRTNSYCLSVDEGISHQQSNFGMYQRLFSVYDGPAFQDSNAYLNITTRRIDDCTPYVDSVNKAGFCDPPDKSKSRQSAWLAGDVQGLLKAKPANGSAYCYMPNAAIGWKQPNGFYYPPAFHSLNLAFDNVDIRHFVVSPLFTEGTNVADMQKVSDQYCKYNTTLFNGFAGNDRQTVLNDDDGSLTGYKETTVINLDDFFAAPVDATQCRSDKSSRTSPYEYVSTVIYPACVYTGTCAKAPVVGNPNTNDGGWNRACTNEFCYGVPLWRQDRMPIADKGVDKSIRMMGQATGQRSSLTANHATYYIDTTVDDKTQLKCSSSNPADCVINVFKPNETYYLFLIFAKESTEQTYRFYVGDNTDFDPASIEMVQAPIGKPTIPFAPLGPLPPGRAHWLGGDKATAKGVVEVNVKLADLPGLMTKIATADMNKCKPASYCTWNKNFNNGEGQCERTGPDGKPNGDASVCRWAIADQDCPDGGCFGIKFTLPAGFTTRAAGDPRPDPRPASVCVAKAAPWDTSLDALKVSDGVCPQPADTQPADFCN